MLKRSSYIVFSIAGLIIVCPVIATLAFRIKAGNRGPAFYRGLRVGRNGKPFRIFKFRTMAVNADRIGGPSTTDMKIIFQTLATLFNTRRRSAGT